MSDDQEKPDVVIQPAGVSSFRELYEKKVGSMSNAEPFEFLEFAEGRRKALALDDPFNEVPVTNVMCELSRKELARRGMSPVPRRDDEHLN